MVPPCTDMSNRTTTTCQSISGETGIRVLGSYNWWRGESLDWETKRSRSVRRRYNNRDPDRKEARMRAVGLLPALLLGFVPFQLVFGAEPGVTLTICNAGTVDLDAYLVRASSTLAAHVVPAKCGVLEKVEGAAKPGTIGFGFTGTNGQWRGVRRTDGWPESGNGVFAPVKQTLSVKHGSADVRIAGLV